MALSNFILTVVGVSVAVVFLRYDVKRTAAIVRRNAGQIKKWLEQESGSVSKAPEKRTPKELESKVPKEDIPKEDKH